MGWRGFHGPANSLSDYGSVDMIKQRGAPMASGRSSPTSPLETKRPILSYLRGSLSTFTPTERSIAKHILADPERVVVHSITDFIRMSGVSHGSIVGFCRGLGLKGFAEFKLTLTRELAQAVMPASTGASDGTGFGHMFDLHVRSLIETLEANAHSRLEQVATALQDARRVEFFSMGFSYPVAIAAALKLMAIGRQATAHADAHMQLVAATQLRQGDVAFGISSSGVTRETVRCLEIARERGATTICLTSAMGSPITKSSDLSLYAMPGEVKYHQALLASRVAQLAVIDALFMWLATNSEVAAQMLEKSTAELLERQQR